MHVHKNLGLSETSVPLNPMVAHHSPMTWLGGSPGYSAVQETQGILHGNLLWCQALGLDCIETDILPRETTTTTTTAIAITARTATTTTTSTASTPTTKKNYQNYKNHNNNLAACQWTSGTLFHRTMRATVLIMFARKWWFYGYTWGIPHRQTQTYHQHFRGHLRHPSLGRENLQERPAVSGTGLHQPKRSMDSHWSNCSCYIILSCVWFHWYSMI